TIGNALMVVLTTARNALVACRPPFGTTVRRQPATPRRQPQHPRSTAPRQSLQETQMHGTIDLAEDPHLAAARETARSMPLSDFDVANPELFKTDTFW